MRYNEKPYVRHNKRSYGINLQSVLPVRAYPYEVGEQVTQLLFGEVFEILLDSGEWCKIKNYTDEYVGWANVGAPVRISLKEYMEIISNRPFILNSFTGKIRSLKSGESMYLSKGSLIHFYYEKEKTFGFGKHIYKCLEGDFVSLVDCPDSLLQTAKSFLNVPYLWGGKNVFGMDCSGFVQLVFRLHSVILPRDAKDQFEEGVEVASADIREKDVAFFKDMDGRIVHVGIMLNQKQIIHASGKVKIDSLDEIGIFSEDLKKYTHILCGFKRYK
ncbi:MAG: C40 family peptidase [Candidatus Azobacteroides sp.]|nr:C40 family peptidase [Candidatus Azobacteroides sp.]